MTPDIPDTAMAREAAELVRDTAGPLLFDHSSRVYLFGALQGQRRGLAFDAELLYVAALFHDLGMVEGHRSDRRFELDGADEAREFRLGHGVDAERARTAWTAIALHTTPGIPEHMEPEVAGHRRRRVRRPGHRLPRPACRGPRRGRGRAPAAGLQAAHPRGFHRGHP